MTLLQVDDWPTKSRSPTWCGARKRCYQKRYFQKRYCCFWILAGIFPLMLLRMMLMFNLNAIPWSSHVQTVAPEIESGLDGLELLEAIHGNRRHRSGDTLPVPFDDSLNELERDVRTVATAHSSMSEDDKRKARTEFEDADESGANLQSAAIIHDDNIDMRDTHEVNKAGKAILDTKHVDQDFADEKASKEEEAGDVATGRHSNSGGRGAESRNRSNLDSHAEANAIVEQMEIMEVTESEEKLNQQGRTGLEQRNFSPDKSEKATDEAEDVIQLRDNVKDEKLHQDGGTVRDVAELQTDNDLEQRSSDSEGECDLFSGDWIPEPEAPLYSNATCFYIQGDQNCMSNGRRDTGYLHWKWKPWGCDLPRFDPRAFLTAFQGKSIGFVGDSLCRNQMQSLLCMLSQVQIPKRVYQSADDKTVRWLYEDFNVTLGAVWSPYLLKESSKGVMGYEKGRSVLFLDELDTAWTSVLHEFDIIVLSFGQWYVKSSVYVKQDKVVGGHNFHELNLTSMDYRPVYGEAVRQVIERVASEFKGVAILSTFAMAHFEGGPWDNGGQCRREVPLSREEGQNFPGYHMEMHDIFMEEYRKVLNDKSKIAADAMLELLDVTKVALTRADGHPGPYNHLNPFEGRNSSDWVPNDCLHWCLPGPVDTWNQLLVKLALKHM